MRKSIIYLTTFILVFFAYSSCDINVSEDEEKADSEVTTDDGTGENDAGSDDDSITDPAADVTEPGLHETEGGPTLTNTVTDFTIPAGTASTLNISSSTYGTVSNYDGNGTWYIETEDGTQRVSGRLATSNGSYDVTIPVFCGKQIIKLVWSNANGILTLALSYERTSCTKSDIQATISWGDGVYDLEMHLIREGGVINNTDGGISDCTWTNMNPDWGVSGDTSDNPEKDIDHTGQNGVENIYLSKPENIKYNLLVEYWSTGVNASPTVVINVSGKTYTYSVNNFNSHEVWHVAKIDWTTTTVTEKETIIDCSDNWSSGCKKSIP